MYQHKNNIKHILLQKKLTDDHEAHVADGALGGPGSGNDARQSHAARAC